MKRLLLLLLCALPLLAAATGNKADSTWFARNYTKKETYVPMRDDVQLFTTIYGPKNKSEKHPILMIRSPYSVTLNSKVYSNL